MHRIVFCVVLICSLAVLLGVPYPYAHGQGIGARRADLENQIAALEKEAQSLDKTLQSVQGESRTLANTITSLDTQVKRRELEIRRLNLVLRKTEFEIGNKGEAVELLTAKIAKSRKTLAASLFILYTRGNDDPIAILTKHKTVSDFFDALHGITRLQTGLQTTLTEFKEDRQSLETEKQELQEFQEDQQGIKSLQEIERRFLAQKKKEKDELLRLTRGKEALFQKLLQSKKRDIATLKTQLFYLEKTGITAEEAVRVATLAASRAGIRPAFLLALLEVETGKQFEDGIITAGTHLGTGHWKEDLYNCYVSLGKRGAAEAEKNAFMKITSRLGLDPDKMRVSRRPNYGCGGAMGPAQFLPTTWLRFSERVTELTGHSPANPWNVEDAFTAAAIFLADAGADGKTNATEIAAARTYISGNPACKRSICSYYSSRILALSREIDRIL